MTEENNQKTAKYIEYLSMASALLLIFVLAPFMYLSLGEPLIAGMIVIIATIEFLAIKYFIVPTLEEQREEQN